jgi:hypothetical protein
MTIAERLNGKVSWKTGTVTVSITSIIAFALIAYNDLSGKTRVAIEVAKDHGTELKLLREDYTALRGEIAGLRTTINRNMDDRFRGTDWERERRWIEQRFENLEQQIGRCCR